MHLNKSYPILSSGRKCPRVNLSPIKTSETFGIPHLDPEITPDEEFQFDICGSHQSEVPENDYGNLASFRLVNVRLSFTMEAMTE